MPLKHTYSVISTFFLNKFFINFSPFPSLNNPSPNSSLKNYDFLSVSLSKCLKPCRLHPSLSATLFAMHGTIINFKPLSSPNNPAKLFKKIAGFRPLFLSKSLKSCCLHPSLSATLFAMPCAVTNFNPLTSTNAPCETFLQKSFCHFHIQKGPNTVYVPSSLYLLPHPQNPQNFRIIKGSVYFRLKTAK